MWKSSRASASVTSSLETTSGKEFGGIGSTRLRFLGRALLKRLGESKGFRRAELERK